jgi:ribonuclease Z
MLEIVFLGTGSGIPTPKRNPAAIYMRYESDNEHVMLFDCGEGTQRQMMKAKGVNFMRISRIFITHWHADHWAGLIGLIQTMNLEKRKKPLYIYGPEAERFVSDILDLDYWGPRFQIIAKNIPFEGQKITEIVKEKDFAIFSTPVNHSVPAVAYCLKEHDMWNVDLKKAGKYGLKQSPLIGKLKKEGKLKVKVKGKDTVIRLKDIGKLNPGLKVVYSGDTKSCSTLTKISKKADLLIHDSTFMEEREARMHGGVKDAAQTAKKAGAKKLILTHFSRRYQDLSPLEKEAKKVFKNTVTAEDFMRIDLKRKK